MLAKGRSGFAKAYDAIRVPKKWRFREPVVQQEEFGDLPDPDSFDYCGEGRERR